MEGMPRTPRCSGRIGVKDRPMKFTTKSTISRATTPGRATTARKPGPGPATRLAAGPALLVEGQDEDECHGAQRGGDEERAADADRVGEQPAREGADRGGEDLCGLDAAHRAARLLPRGLRGGHRQPEGADAAEQPDADPQDEELLDARHRGAQGEEDHVQETSAFTAMPLWPCLSASRPHTGARSPARSGAGCR